MSQPISVKSNYTDKTVQLRELYFGPQNQKILRSDQCYGMVLRTIRVQVRQLYKFVDVTIPCIAIVNKILCHRYRSCEFSRVIKQYAIRKNDLSKKKKCSKQIDKRFEKTPRKNDTSFSFRGQSRVHAKQCIGCAAKLTFSVESKWNGYFQLGQFVHLFAS